MTTICILNLSEPKIDPVPFSFPDNVGKTSDLNQIPKTGALVLYVLAHGVPDGFTVGPQRIFYSEVALAEGLISQRPDVPTLCIWDLCHAQTFLAYGGKGWPQNFAHIFSCQAHERTWHTGQRSGGPPAQSVFSQQLELAIRACKETRMLTWSGIEAELVRRLGPVQTPSISAPPTYQAAHFFGS